MLNKINFIKELENQFKAGHDTLSIFLLAAICIAVVLILCFLFYFFWIVPCLSYHLLEAEFPSTVTEQPRHFFVVPNKQGQCVVELPPDHTVIGMTPNSFVVPTAPPTQYAFTNHQNGMQLNQQFGMLQNDENSYVPPHK
jgi:hypothetical protein